MALTPGKVRCSPSSPCSLKGAARGCGWLRSSLPLRSAPWPLMSRPGRENGSPAEPENYHDRSRRRPYGTARFHCEALRNEIPARNTMDPARFSRLFRTRFHHRAAARQNATARVRLSEAERSDRGQLTPLPSEPQPGLDRTSSAPATSRRRRRAAGRRPCATRGRVNARACEVRDTAAC